MEVVMNETMGWAAQRILELLLASGACATLLLMAACLMAGIVKRNR